MPGKWWTNEEIEKLKELYPKTKAADLEKIMNRSINSIREKASRLGIESFTEGEYHWNWKGGRNVTASGYIEVLDKENPKAKCSGYILEHRKVMSEFIGRPLTDDEDVHHINEIKDDNRIENLELMTRGEHVRLHQTGKIASDETKKKISDFNKERFKDRTKIPMFKDVPILEMLELAQSGMNVKDVCALYGISDSTYYAKLRREKDEKDGSKSDY